MKKGNHFITAIICGLLAFLLICSCDESSEEYDQRLQQTRINIVSGDNQVERIGSELPAPLVIQTTNILGTLRPGVQVRFSSGDPGAEVNPDMAATDSEGFASFRFKLGTEPGSQSASVVCDDDSVAFTATAREIECDEESLEKLNDWPSGHILITTTSSSLLDAPGSVLIDYDPQTNDIEEVLETQERLIDLALSPRGELFVATNTEVFKVDPESKMLESYTLFPSEMEVEIEPNPGGVLVCGAAIYKYLISCPQQELSDFYSILSLPENLAINHGDRTIYFIRGYDNYFRIEGSLWDGRSQILKYDFWNSFDAPVAEPRGMCVDSTGAVYVTLDGNEETRSILKFNGNLDNKTTIFDFYEHFGRNNTAAGRWGDITVIEDVLYLIDRRNDRIAFISTSGDYLGDYESNAFSLPGIENERYGIAAIP